MKTDLSKKPEYFRSPVLKSKLAAIEPVGGDNQVGLISGFAVITVGEALGHDMWIDEVFLQQTAEAINAAPNGIKARFTHPSLSGDGLGSYLGRVKNASIDGEVVRADLHFAESAQHSPDGNLAEYVLLLAMEDSEAFGSSIAFTHDWNAADEFLLEHGGMQFESPDPRNENNYPHIRLAKLRAVDAVDEPAANPNGLFHRGEKIAHEADQLLSYALGISSTAPQTSCFDIDPDRLSGFVSRFLSQHGLSVTPSQQPTKEPPVMADENPPMSRDDALAEVRKDMAKFSAEFGERGLSYFNDGLSFEEALQKENAHLKSEFQTKQDALQAQVTELQAKIDQINLGENQPVGGGSGADSGKEKGELSADQEKLIKTAGKSHGSFAAMIKVPSKK